MFGRTEVFASIFALDISCDLNIDQLFAMKIWYANAKGYQYKTLRGFQTQEESKVCPLDARG